jgi:EAL domain-containing protein (putative c-di-GMP-specific phosphodiesterase class I)
MSRKTDNDPGVVLQQASRAASRLYSSRMASLALLSGLILLVALLVHATGGTRNAYLHLMYVPLFIAGAWFGIAGGILAGLCAGILLGPWMPMDVATGQMQLMINWVARTALFMLSAGVAGVLVAVVKRQEDQLSWLAYHSSATTLPNREALVLALQGRNDGCAVVVIGINTFEHIINAFGSYVADNVLQAAAQRLQELDRRIGTVFDLRSHKLAFLWPEGEAELMALVERLQVQVNQPLEVDGVPIHVDVSLGAAGFEDKAQSPELLVRRANIAQVEAARQGLFYSEYRHSNDESRKRNMSRLASFPRAIRNSELFLEYQPKVDLQSGKTVGFEALARWRHPVIGIIPPNDFVPLVEQTALVHPFTRWVLRAAIAHVATLGAAGFYPNVAVNISPRNLLDETLPDHIRNTLREFRVSAGQLELEITESAIVRAGMSALESLKELRARGVRVSIDDFGAGHTALRNLTELPVDCLKIDQAFIRTLLQDTRREEIVRAIIQLAGTLGLSVVAEGIEDRETAERLRAMNCGMGQGYFYSRPMAASNLKHWLENMGVDQPGVVTT